MKRIVLIFLIFVPFVSCKKDDGCVDERKKGDYHCLTVYEPVCGCDGNTYGNYCVAEREGVTSWTEGTCD
jgi:hypothetical protein